MGEKINGKEKKQGLHLVEGSRSLDLKKRLQFEHNQRFLLEQKVLELENANARLKGRLDLSDDNARSLQEYYNRLSTRASQSDIEKEEVEKMVKMDPFLHKLYNRAAFIEMMNKELDRAKERGHSVAIMMFDIDEFKQKNDQYGHNVGDAVLLKLMEIMNSFFRSRDVIGRKFEANGEEAQGRMGGEEFAVVLPNIIDKRKIIKRIEDFRKKVESTKISVYSEKLEREVEVGVTVSIGVAIYPVDGSEKNIYDIADRLMYQAKEQGRNQVVVATKPAEGEPKGKVSEPESPETA